MPEANDMELLRDYCQTNSETAFAELVQRHVALVYSAALRHAGITAHAEEITQAVFIILARKAGGLRPNTILEGWLYETTRLTALSFLRGEHRRQKREQEAYMQSALQDSTDDLLWKQLSPLLDDAMGRLGKNDRDAVVLRFFKNKSVSEIAATMQVSEAAAQRRVLRALEKLRKFFTKRGVSSTTAIIAGTISANSVQAAPVALAKTVAAVAIAKGSIAAASTLTLVKGTLKLMAWTKMKIVAVIGAGILLATGSATLLAQKTSVAPEKQPAQSIADKPPVAEPPLTTWQRGDKTDAVNKFISADWTARPLFDSNSILSLTEKQFAQQIAPLSAAQQKAKTDEMTARLNLLKQLAAAVAQSGRDALANGDKSRAIQCFDALKQCGTALDSPDCLQLVQLVGRAFKKMSDTETAKLR